MSKKITGKLINSTSGIKVTLEIAKAKNKKGEAIEFIRINTDKKPSQTVINAIKLQGGSYFNKDQSWSLFNSVRNQKFVNKMILKDAFKIEVEEEEEVKTSKPKQAVKGKAQASKAQPKSSLEKRVDKLEDKLDKILALLSK